MSAITTQNLNPRQNLYEKGVKGQKKKPFHHRVIWSCCCEVNEMSRVSKTVARAAISIAASKMPMQSQFLWLGGSKSGQRLLWGFKWIVNGSKMDFFILKIHLLNAFCSFLFLPMLFFCLRSGKPSVSESWADKVIWNQGCLLLSLTLFYQW